MLKLSIREELLPKWAIFKKQFILELQLTLAFLDDSDGGFLEFNLFETTVAVAPPFFSRLHTSLYYRHTPENTYHAITSAVKAGFQIAFEVKGGGQPFCTRSLY